MTVKRERKAIIHKPYVIHIFSAFWLRSDMFDLPPDNYAFVICTRYIYKYEAVLNPFYWMVSEFEDTDDKRNSKSFNLRDAKKICDYILTLPSWVSDFFQVEPGNKDQLVFEGKKSMRKFNVTINTPRDPRFGGDFKKLLAAESENKLAAGDIILIYKYEKCFCLECIMKGDVRHQTLWDLFVKDKNDSDGRHLVFFSDEGEEKNDDEDVEMFDLRDRFEKYLREIRGLSQWERQAREIGDWSQRLLEKGVINKYIYSVYDYSNSQNKVDASDFFSNHPFHIRMEEYSRKTPIPSQGGNQFQQYWFYERTRGQYNQGNKN